MVAVAHGHVDAVMVLLGMGSSVEASDIYNRTALHRGVSLNPEYCCLLHQEWLYKHRVVALLQRLSLVYMI